MNIVKGLIASIISILIVISINHLPLSDILQKYFSEANSDLVENIIFNYFIVFFVFKYISYKRLPLFIFDELKLTILIFIIPLVLYVFIFSNIYSSFSYLSLSLISTTNGLIYANEIFSSILLEELLFRGLILGTLIMTLNHRKKWIFECVLISSLFFGTVHLINFWTFEGQTVKSVLNQVYAATCIGFLWCSVYIKTKNLALIIVIHFLSNYFAGLQEYVIGSPNTLSNKNLDVIHPLSKIIIEELIRIIIYGIPLILGLLILNEVNEKDKTIWKGSVK